MCSSHQPEAGADSAMTTRSAEPRTIPADDPSHQWVCVAEHGHHYLDQWGDRPAAQASAAPPDVWRERALNCMKALTKAEQKLQASAAPPDEGLREALDRAWEHAHKLHPGHTGPRENCPSPVCRDARRALAADTDKEWDAADGTTVPNRP